MEIKLMGQDDEDPLSPRGR